MHYLNMNIISKHSREAKMKTNEGDSLDIKMNIFRDKSFSESQKFTSKIPPISVSNVILKVLY